MIRRVGQSYLERSLDIFAVSQERPHLASRVRMFCHGAARTKAATCTRRKRSCDGCEMPCGALPAPRHRFFRMRRIAP